MNYVQYPMTRRTVMRANKPMISPVRNALKIQNTFTGDSGALGAGDRGAWQTVPQYTGNPYDYNSYIERWRQYCHLYETTWEARKIIRIPVEDALRKPWELENIDEAYANVLKTATIKYGFTDSLKRACMLERLLGGSIQFFGMESEVDDVSQPFHPRLEPRKLRFINVIPISRISRVNWEFNPLNEGYMRPSAFLINGHEMHISRCILWDGEPLFDPYDFALTQFRANLAGFGPSKLAPIWDDIVKAVGTRQAAYQLIQTNNALIMMISQLQDLGGTKPGKSKIKELKEIANSLSVYRAALIDKEKVEVSQHSASFGSVPELLMMFLQVLSAASDIPATRFIGQAPGGLNATGESDLENYYNMIDAYQHQRLVPAIRKFYDVVGYNFWHDKWDRIREDLDIKFPPMWNLSELEDAQKNQIELANIMQAWQEGLLPDEKAIEELNLKGIFQVELEPDEIDVMKSIQDEAGILGLGQGKNIVEKASGRTGDRRSGAGEYDREDPVKTTFAESSALKKPALPKVQNTKYDPQQMLAGMQVEMEHGDVTGGDPVEIAKIVRAHLDEDENYYSKLHKAIPVEPDPKDESEGE